MSSSSGYWRQRRPEGAQLESARGVDVGGARLQQAGVLAPTMLHSAPGGGAHAGHLRAAHLRLLHRVTFWLADFCSFFPTHLSFLYSQTLHSLSSFSTTTLPHAHSHFFPVFLLPPFATISTLLPLPLSFSRSGILKIVLYIFFSVVLDCFQQMIFSLLANTNTLVLTSTLTLQYILQFAQTDSVNHSVSSLL